jgi:AAA+ superfamily predicted ATPase
MTFSRTDYPDTDEYFIPEQFFNGCGYGGPGFANGIMVCLVNEGQYVMNHTNPTWGRYEGSKIKGRIMSCSFSSMRIEWENGQSNGYEASHCVIGIIRTAPLVKPKPKPADFTKLDRVVVATEVREEVEAVLKQHENRDKMFKDWGLEEIGYGKGMTFLFYGGPGTGKTWMATCIGEAMGVEILSIGAAEIQSSEPGGANRAIQAAFKECKDKGKILFIDECDSLITSRNDVGMILGGEINTLLTEIEKTEGIVILATNRIENLDAALERRISLIVEFPEPTFEQRQVIWEKTIPKKMPLNKDVKLDKLSEYKLTGGQIKNAVLQAARLALAEDAKAVNEQHFENAIKRINKSKNLMGTASRYEQVSVKTGKVKTPGFSK